MSARFFLDTNVLVYTFDPREPVKQTRATELVTEALQGHGMISFQVVQEFLSVASRKFVQPLSAADCRAYLDTVLEPLCEIFQTMDFYRRAVEIMDRWKYGLYDSLVIAAALDGGCRTLYSEDLHDGQAIEGLTIVNPFRV